MPANLANGPSETNRGGQRAPDSNDHATVAYATGSSLRREAGSPLSYIKPPGPFLIRLPDPSHQQAVSEGGDLLGYPSLPTEGWSHEPAPPHRREMGQGPQRRLWDSSTPIALH